MLSVDFSMYLEAQQKAEQAYRDKDAWTRKCIACVAKMGRFSSDRTIQDYAREIWSANPVPVRKTRKKRS
jgi:starch phosphorylase